jgi:hypothetical protein
VEARLDAFAWGFAMLWFTGITPFMLTMLAAFTVCLDAMDDDRRAPQWPRAAPS